MKLTTSINLNLLNKLKKESYFHKFFLARARDDIAQQIRNLRSRRKLTQGEFAERAEMKQSAVSRIEQADYAGWNFKTLARVAETLQARLLITFIPMEDVIKEYELKERQTQVLNKSAILDAFSNRNRYLPYQDELEKSKESAQGAYYKNTQGKLDEINRNLTGTSGLAISSAQGARSSGYGAVSREH